jgi:hypothetical protein
VQGMTVLNNAPAVDLGFFDEDKTQRLYAQIDENNKVKYTVQPWDADSAPIE